MSNTAAMEIGGLGVLGLFRDPKKRKGSYAHKDQLDFYSNLDEGNDEGDANSEHFRKRYRFRPKTVKALSLLLGKEIEPLAHTNNAFTAKQKLCIALRFYATGTHQLEVGDGEGASQASVSRIVRQVSEVLSEHMDDIVAFNVDPDVLETVARGFFGFNGKFPNCVGVRDCTHIPVRPPKEHRDQFKNRDGYFSLNVQAVVNDHGAITHVSPRWPGSVHHMRIFKESDLQQVLDQHLLGNKYLLGDQGYKCQTNLLSPYPSEETPKKEHFNISLSQTCVKVECVFGQLKQKFACLTKRPDIDPLHMVTVIHACIFLWNFGIITGDNKGYSPEEYVVEEQFQLNTEISVSEGGKVVCDIIANYLWKHK